MHRIERLAVPCLLTAMALSTVTVLVLGQDHGFYSDELSWLTFGDDLSPRTLLTPHNSHLIALPRFLYEVLPGIFGTSYLPFQLIAVASRFACAALLFILVRRRVGSLAALAPAIVLLFFGSASGIALSPIAIPFTFSIAFGLAALVAIEYARLRWDLVALGLLVLSTLSHTFGVIFSGGILIYLLLAPDRRRRVWIAAIPLLGWIAWWLWAQQFDQGIVSASNLGTAPLFVIESAGRALAALTGVAPGLGGRAEDLVVVASAVLALALMILLGLRVRRSGGSPWLYAYMAMALAFWLATALSEGPGRQASTPRYLLFGAIMLVLIAAEALRGKTIGRRGALVLVAISCLAVAGNGLRLALTGDELTDQHERVQTQLAMVELAGGAATPTFAPRSVVPRGSEHIAVPARSIIAFAEDTGPLGFTLERVREQDESVREDADFVLARAIGLTALPSSSLEIEQATSCRTFPAGPGTEAAIQLDPGIDVLRLEQGSSQPLLLGRFADSASVPIGELSQGAEVTVTLSSDAAAETWFATVSGTLRVCSPP